MLPSGARADIGQMTDVDAFLALRMRSWRCGCVPGVERPGLAAAVVGGWGGTGHAEVTREHTSRSITASVSRAREVLGYAPRYTSLDALRETLSWLVANGQADVGGQPLSAPGPR
jgi:hypothetical protein